MQPKQRRFSFGTTEIDEVDVRILAILQTEGRISKSDLAARINLSNSACFDRMLRLEKSGLVESYRAQLDLRKLGDPQMIQVHVILDSHQSEDLARFERRILEEEMIIECTALGGGIDYALTVWALRIDDYQSLMTALLDAGLGIKRYFTYVVTKRVKHRDVGIEDLVKHRLSSASPFRR